MKDYDIEKVTTMFNILLWYAGSTVERYVLQHDTLTLGSTLAFCKYSPLHGNESNLHAS